MDNNVFTINDLTPVVNQPLNKSPDDILKTIESIFSKITEMKQKADVFKAKFGKNPETKQELRTMRPATDNYSASTQEMLYRKRIQELEAEIKTLKNTKNITNGVVQHMNINEKKLKEIVDNTINSLIKQAEPYKDMKVSELLSKYNTFKIFIKPKLLENIKQAILEVVEYDRKENNQE